MLNKCSILHDSNFGLSFLDHNIPTRKYPDAIFFYLKNSGITEHQTRSTCVVLTMHQQILLGILILHFHKKLFYKPYRWSSRWWRAVPTRRWTPILSLSHGYIQTIACSIEKFTDLFFIRTTLSY